MLSFIFYASYACRCRNIAAILPSSSLPQKNTQQRAWASFATSFAALGMCGVYDIDQRDMDFSNVQWWILVKLNFSWWYVDFALEKREKKAHFFL